MSKFQIKKDDLRYDLFSRIKMMLNDNIDLSLKNNELRKSILNISNLKHSFGDGLFSVSNTQIMETTGRSDAYEDNPEFSKYGRT